jgi:hypothetical protein
MQYISRFQIIFVTLCHERNLKAERGQLYYRMPVNNRGMRLLLDDSHDSHLQHDARLNQRWVLSRHTTMTAARRLANSSRLLETWLFYWDLIVLKINAPVLIHSNHNNCQPLQCYCCYWGECIYWVVLLARKKSVLSPYFCPFLSLR